MKKLLLALIFLASFTGFAEAQCNGVFPNNTACGNISGSSNTPRAIPLSSFPANAPGGNTGDIQYNAGGGIFGGEPQVTTTQGGTGANNSTNVSGEVLASNGTNGNFIHTGLASLFNSACTIAPSLCAKFTGHYSPYWYGALCDGSTDDTTAIGNAITGAAGNRLLFPAATCVVSNTNALLSNSTYSGVNRNVSIIKSTACLAIFTATNISNLTVTDLWLQGTDACVTWPVGNFGAFHGILSTDQRNWTFRNLRNSKFNSNYWNAIMQTAGSFADMFWDDILLETATADAGTITNNPNIGIQIQSAAAGQRIQNVNLNRIEVNGADLCFHVILYNFIYRYQITNSRFISPGGTNTNTHCTNGGAATNAYAITLYDINDDGNPLQDGLVADNYILNPIASGVYCVSGSAFTRAATATPLLIANNEIVGQTSSDVLLPRGAVALNACTDVTISGNKLFNNATCINAAVQNAGNLSILNNDCYSGAGSSNGLIVVAGSNGSSNTDKRVIRGNLFETSGTAVTFTSSTGARFNNVDLSGNTIVADGAAAGAGLTAGNLFITGMFNVKDNTFLGASSGVMMNLSISAGNVGLMGNTFNTPAGVGGILAASIPAAVNGSQLFIQDGTAGSSPCTGGGTGSTAMRQNGAWKCF